MKKVLLSVLGLECIVSEQNLSAAVLQTEIPNEKNLLGKTVATLNKVSDPLSVAKNKNLRQKRNVAKKVAVSVALALALTTSKTNAQQENSQNEQIQTLLNGEVNIRITGTYGAVVTSASRLNDGLGLLLGGRGGIILNNSFLVGAAGYGIIPTHKVNCLDVEHTGNHYLTGGYGGLFLEYAHAPNRLLHFSANTIVGMGGVTYARLGDNRHDPNAENNNRHPGSFVFVIEPGVAMDVNLTKAFRLSLGVSYRYSPNFNLQYENRDIVPNTAFNGLSLNLIFKFGNFSGVHTRPAIFVPPVYVPQVYVR